MTTEKTWFSSNVTNNNVSFFHQIFSTTKQQHIVGSTDVATEISNGGFRGRPWLTRQADLGLQRTPLNTVLDATAKTTFCNYTVSQKNPCDYVFDDNLNSKRPIVIIFGTVIT